MTSRGRQYQIPSTVNHGASCSDLKIKPSHGTGIDTLVFIHPSSGLNGKAPDFSAFADDFDGWFLPILLASRAVEKLAPKSDALKSWCLTTLWMSLLTSA